MIRDENELRQARQALLDLEAAYDRLRAEYEASRPRTFALMAHSYTSEIASLTQAIHEYLGVPTLALPDTFDILIRLKGPRVKLGTFPAGAAADCLKRFESGVASIAVARTARAPSARTAARKRCKFPLAGVGPGSVTFYLCKPNEPDQRGLFEEDVSSEALSALVTGALRCESDAEAPSTDPTQVDFDANTVDLSVFTTLAALLPKQAGVDSVEVELARREDELAGRRIVITERIAGVAKDWAGRIASAGIRITDAGVIRAVNLDTRVVKLSNRDQGQKPLACTYGSELDERISLLLNRRVIATGILRIRGPRNQHLTIESIRPEE